MAAPFRPKAPAEKKLLTFNFAPEMPVGVTLSTPLVDAVVLEGTDDPISLVITAIAVNIAPITLSDGTVIAIGQAIQCLADAGVEGVTYQFHATGVASNGEHNEIVATMKVYLLAAKGV